MAQAIRDRRVETKRNFGSLGTQKLHNKIVYYDLLGLATGSTKSLEPGRMVLEAGPSLCFQFKT
jgi:hypothetical protein